MSSPITKALPLCTVRGLKAPGRMCGAVIVGGVYCGSKNPCEHKDERNSPKGETIEANQQLSAINSGVKSMRVYVAGPMTGLPEYNYPAFHAAAKQLRALGHEVFNPADNPVPACGTWEVYMRMAIGQLVQCDAIALLPGWEASRGASEEHRLGHLLSMQVRRLEDMLAVNCGSGA